MQLSVILSTRNHAGLLCQFLESVTACDTPDTWELIVVDNGSTDETESVILTFRDRLPVVYCYQGVPGKGISINKGLRRARGEIILFTDDDVCPHRNWLIGHVNAMKKNPSMNIIGGRIVVDRSALPGWLDRSSNLRGMLVSEHDLGDAARPYTAPEFPFGPNMSVRRSALAGLARPWPEDIGPGRLVFLGDEIVFAVRISAADGSDRLYEPSCLVEHRPRIGRHFFLEALRRCFTGGYAAGYCRLDAGTAATRGSASILSLAGLRLRRARSLQEILCMGVRGLGYGWGRLYGSVRRPHAGLLQTEK